MANALTAARLALAPVVAYLIVAGSELAIGVFGLAALTDFFDGIIARSRNQVTDVGRVLDPLTDRLFIAAVVVGVYLREQQPPIWALAALLARDAAVVAGSGYLVAQRERIDVSFLGKAATATLLAAIFLLLLRQPAGLWLFYGGLLASLASGFGYLVQGKKVLTSRYQMTDAG